MLKTRVHLYNTVIDNTYTDRRDSIVLPTNVHKILAICPNLVNGAGYISVYNEKNNEQLLNQVLVSDDEQHWNVKNVPILNIPECNNLFYVLRLIESDFTKNCRLKLYITYI